MHPSDFVFSLCSIRLVIMNNDRDDDDDELLI